jgi:group II intron reverse transcriptase/maturase
MDAADQHDWYRQKDKQGVILTKPDLSGGKGGSLAELTINENEVVLMLAETVIRRLEALGTISQQGKRLNGLFRLMENPLLWHEAYANIYANHGALTKGADDVTLDGFSHKRVNAIIAQLKAGTYCFKPVRRTSIRKANGKKRPLGVSSGNDKVVQEVVRIILERIYEPVFDNNSHGFRPGRSPHTALEQIRQEWTAVKWLVDMDLQSYFDSIPQDVLIALLEKKIEDKRFIRLIKAMLDAGYLEDWTYHTTYSGVPQGSIASPILANVVLHALDLFMKHLKHQFETGKRRKANKDYIHYSNKINRLRRKYDTLKGKEENTEKLQEIKQVIQQLKQRRRKVPSSDPFEEAYKRLYYCRYADDFGVGIISSKADAEAVRQKIKQYVEGTLKLTVSEKKSRIRHAKEGVMFLGYWIKTYTGNRIVKVKRGKRHFTFESVNERLQLQIPPEKLLKFCISKRYGNYNAGKTRHKQDLVNLSDAEIILAYNAELRGFANYYAPALNAKRDMNKLAYLWWQSLLKTLARKHKTTVNKTAKRLKRDDGYALIVEGEKKTRVIRVFRLKDLKPPTLKDSQVDIQPNIFALTLSRSELIRRLNAEQCEYCGTVEDPFEVHHIRRMKDVEHGKQLWQKVMASRNRKTLILCLHCHHLLHAGKLPDVSYYKNKQRESRIP